MRNPLIAITVDVSGDSNDERTRGKMCLNYNYAEQVALAGGNPILITPVTQLAALVGIIDGWLIPGGEDIDASHYGQPNHIKATLQDPRRWEMEAALYSVLPPTLPVLGICYGCQFLNVRRKGSLYQHLPDFLGHEEHGAGTLQLYTVQGDSNLASATKTLTIEGKSYHHQSIENLGSDLRVTAKSPDGVIEAIEDPNHPFFVGVQWHPERTPHDLATQNLMLSFVSAARNFREGIK